MAKITLYYMPLSAPCRSVLMASKLVGAQLDLKLVNLLEGEHLQAEFLEKNPQHTIPTIDDDGFYLAESRAILTYLVDKFGRQELYPSDVRQRALVNQRLYFDMTLYQRYADYFYPVLWQGATELDEKLKGKLIEALNFLETFLGKTHYAAGDHLTIADVSLLSTVTTIEISDPTLLDNHPKIKAWLETLRAEIPDYHDVNQQGTDEFSAIVRRARDRIAGDPKDA